MPRHPAPRALSLALSLYVAAVFLAAVVLSLLLAPLGGVYGAPGAVQRLARHGDAGDAWPCGHFKPDCAEAEQNLCDPPRCGRDRCPEKTEQLCGVLETPVAGRQPQRKSRG